jgi:stress responsive alpha/beta barrel protein
MIAHLATFTFRDGVTAAEVDQLADDLRAMAGALPSVHRYLCGRNLGLRPAGADLGVVALVDDQAGLDAYLDSPAHTELVARSITPRLATRQALQLELTSEWLGWSDG